MSPVKEPEFFSRGVPRRRPADDAGPRGRQPRGGRRAEPRAPRGARTVPRIFERAGDEKVRGEASTGYLAHPTAAARLHRHVPTPS